MAQKNVDILVLLKYVSNFWRTLEMLIINCEINVILTLNSVANQDATVAITDGKLYVPVVTLSTQDNVKLLDQLKSGFKRTIN